MKSEIFSVIFSQIKITLLLFRHDLSREIKVENDSDDDSTKLEEMNVKFEQNECDNISRLGIKSEEEDFESGLKFEDSDIVMEESEGINENFNLKKISKNYMATSETKLKVAKKPHFCSLGCGKKFGGQQSMRLHVSKACKMNPDITGKGGLISASFLLFSLLRMC